MLIVSQIFSIGAPTVYTDEATYKAALNSYYLSDFSEYTDYGQTTFSERTSGEYKYSIEGFEGIYYKGMFYPCPGLLSFNPISHNTGFYIKNIGKEINAFGGNFYFDSFPGAATGEIIFTVGDYKYTYTSKNSTSFLGFIFPEAVIDLKITGKSPIGSAIMCLDNFYVGNANTTTAVSNVLDKTTVTVSPNPVADVMNISTNAVISSVVLKDLTGKTVLESGNSSSIDLSGLTKGIYLARINTANGTVTKQIIKK